MNTKLLIFGLIYFLLNYSYSLTIDCDDIIKQTEKIQQSSIVYATVPSILGLLSIILSCLLIRTIQKWESEDIKALNDCLKKLADTVDQAGIPASLSTARLTAGEKSHSNDESVGGEKRKSSLSELIKKM